MSGQSTSEPDLPAACTQHASAVNITTRSKRQQLADSPNIAVDPFYDFKAELLDMIGTWRTEQDETLSKLVHDVTKLKKQCVVILGSNADIERSMSFISTQYDEVVNKIVNLETEREESEPNIACLQHQLQDLYFQSRVATIEIHNLPTKGQENAENLMAAVSDVGMIVEMEIQSPGSARHIQIARKVRHLQTSC